MVDPYDVTDFARSRGGLEEYWLFCLAVAGKKATMIASKVDEFLGGASADETPFSYVRRLVSEGTLAERLADVRMGKYALLERAYSASVSPGAPDIATASAEELEGIPGVGPKTARFFIVHSRKGARVAVIDTHVLKFLRDRGHRVPPGFPGRRDYARLERIMLSEVDASGLDPAEFDLAVWSHYASGGKTPLPSSPPSLLAA
mgnify:CR=1 FL=1